MSKQILFFVVLVFTVSCATNSEKRVKYITKSDIDHCLPRATLSAQAFSVVPPVASLMAKSMLEKKAQEFKADSIEITKDTGLFHIELEAIGYKCPEEMITKKSKSKRK